jgi:hypothetical protein
MSWVRLLCNLARSSVTGAKFGSFPIDSTDRTFFAFAMYVFSSFMAQEYRSGSDIVMGLENVAK